jgi:hypothetical protein
MKKVVGKLVPEDTLHRLEKNYRVCYDASTSSGLDTPVAGLGPGTHRFQSLGHDPILAWVFGVRDLLNGQFTSIGKNCQLIVQSSGDPLLVGEAILHRIIEALRLVAGHLASDVATSRGLPAPLMPLLLFIQHGTVGKHGYTVSELARQMYRSGYDFRHFLASSLPVLIIDAIVRLAHFAKVLSNGGDLAAAAPGASHTKLQTQLFIAHTIAAATNAGKICITQNPLAVSWPQWLTFFRYLAPQLRWLLVEEERQRSRHVGRGLERRWLEIERDHLKLWESLFGSGTIATL